MKKTHCIRGHERTPENVLPNGTCKQCHRSDTALWYEKTKEHRRSKNRNVRLKRLGWSNSLVKEKKKEQGNRCAICNKKFIKTPHADHKHVCPPIPRGLLCYPCNVALGLFQDNPAILRVAAVYLEKY